MITFYQAIKHIAVSNILNFYDFDS